MNVKKLGNLKQENIVTNQMLSFVEAIKNNSINKFGLIFEKTVKDGLANYKYLLDDGAFALVQEYDTRDGGFLEAHKRFIDVQIILEGQEIIEVAPLDGLEVQTPYSEEKDIAFYEDSVENKHLEMLPETFAVFFPEDAHKPCLDFNKKSRVRKIVLKIPV